MGWQSAQDAMHTRDCGVPGCTGVVYDTSELCAWHRKNGTPDERVLLQQLLQDLGSIPSLFHAT